MDEETGKLIDELADFGGEDSVEDRLDRAAEEQFEIEIEYPRDFVLFCASQADSRTTYQALTKSLRNWLYEAEMDDDLKGIIAHTKFTVNVLPNSQLAEFYHFVENGRLSSELQTACKQSAMVFQIAADGADNLTFFAPFWAAVTAGCLHGSDIDAIALDAYSSAPYTVSVPLWQYHYLCVPLTHQFLSVTGFPDESTGRFTMKSTGMRRFGMPELELLEVPQNFAQYGAYLLRGVAQYMWCAIEKSIPDTTTLRFNNEFDLPANLCELNKAEKAQMHGKLIPVLLSSAETAGDKEARLTVSPTMEFATDDQWFAHIMPILAQTKYDLANV